MGYKRYSKTVRTYWRSKTLLVPFKITKRSYQIKHIECYPTTTMGWTLFKIAIFWNWKERWPRSLSIWWCWWKYKKHYFRLSFTSEEIVKGTALLKSKKASGYDSISNEMIKASLPISLSFLVALFNKILQTQIYPEEWTRRRITPVPKSREIENPDNYRGITIDSCLSKLFNLLLDNRLLCFTDKNNILKSN